PERHRHHPSPPQSVTSRLSGCERGFTLRARTNTGRPCLQVAALKSLLAVEGVVMKTWMRMKQLSTALFIASSMVCGCGGMDPAEGPSVQAGTAPLQVQATLDCTHFATKLSDLQTTLRSALSYANQTGDPSLISDVTWANTTIDDAINYNNSTPNYG